MKKVSSLSLFAIILLLTSCDRPSIEKEVENNGTKIVYIDHRDSLYRWEYHVTVDQGLVYVSQTGISVDSTPEDVTYWIVDKPDSIIEENNHMEALDAAIHHEEGSGVFQQRNIEYSKNSFEAKNLIAKYEDLKKDYEK